VVVGARTEEQLADNLGAADLTLEDDERARLDEVSAPRLMYPYWHQAKSASERLSEADLTPARSAHLSEPRPTAYWLKAVGHARGPLAEDWLDQRPELLHRTGFPRRPRIVPGDRLVMYASVWRRVFAIAQVVGEPGAARPPALAVDDRDRDAARRAGARRGAAGRGDRRRRRAA
jgi:hypothetical protein